MSVNSLDDVIALATSAQATNTTQVSSALKSFVRKDKDASDVLLSGPASSGQDPLQILNPVHHTLPFLYILSARLTTNATSVTQAVIDNFCRLAEPVQLRLAPERVTQLAQSIYKAADDAGSVRAAIPSLRELVRRYPATPAHLTSVHPIFVRACVKAQYFNTALPVIRQPISEIDKNAYDLTYHTSLDYHYSGGICLAALKRFREAEEFLEIVVSSPTVTTPAMLQLDAYNKLSLIQLIAYGKTNPVPKYTHPGIGRIFKASPYYSFVKAYPAPTASLITIIEKDVKTFSGDLNVGLVRQALQRAPRWAVRKLTETYVTLALAEIGKAVGIESEAEVRALVLSMIETREIHATLSAEGTVTFLDPPTSFTKEDIEALLENSQIHAQLLAEFDRELERSRDFLQKAVRDKEGGGSWIMEEMDMGSHGLREAIWDEGDF